MNAKKILPVSFIIFGLLLAACSMPGPATEAPLAPTLPVEGDTPQPATGVPLRPPKVATSTATLAPSGPEDFSTENLNDVPPDGILEEIVSLGFGGVDPLCLFPYAEPTIASDPEDTELMMEAEMVTCGWADGDELTFTVTYPNGRQAGGKKVVDESGRGSFSYRPALDAPEGLYRFEITGRRLKFESNVYFRAPVVPRFYALNEGQLLFNNFQPNEKIRLFLYFDSLGVYVFQGWQEFEMDANGQLLLNAPAAEGYFFAQTESGLELPLTSSDLEQKSFQMNRAISLSADSRAKLQALEASSRAHLACPAGFVSRIDPNAGQVHPIGRAWLYANPRATARQVLSLDPGQALEIASVSPMVCADGRGWRMVYVYVETPSGTLAYSGYVIEIDENQTHQIEPGIALDPTPTPPPSCPGSLTSRLAVDARARVAFTDGSNMRIRAKPGFTQDTLRTVPEGTLLAITGGPMCVDNTTWWRIRTRDGFDGWMAEYKGDVYLVEPFQW
ncbi:MAG: hypothetical protein CVU44_07105 [Chloroflexi bacterium HGW-Chloroflexi-6]|nr:MAG: hypothetical protein CVU44_07105 [Chloroflexi bacterium HGW-Chloroflexi-6]